MTDDEFMERLSALAVVREGPSAGSMGVLYGGKTYMRERDMTDFEWDACRMQFDLLKTLNLGRGGGIDGGR